MKLVTRAQSGLRPPLKVFPGNLSKPSTGHWNGPNVTVHGKTVFDHSACAAVWRGIQAFHMDTRGWNDIAYNFGICQHGYVFEGRGLNVRNGANGTNEGNKTSHCLMMMAGPDNPFNVAEKSAFRDCVKYVSDHTNAPYSAIGHRDWHSTDCPGDARYSWIHGGMKMSGGEVPQPPKKEGALMALSDQEQDELLKKTRENNLLLRQVQGILLGDDPDGKGDTQERQLASLTRIEKELTDDDNLE